jgi:FAD/FMN-containing dehydrogenase
MFPIEHAPEVLRGWRDCADIAPDELSLACVLITAPPEPFVPPELQGKLVLAMAILYVGDPDDGTHVVQPLKDLGPVVDLVAPMPYTAFQSALDATAPWGLPFYASGEYLPDLTDAAIDTLLEGGIELLRGAHPLSQVVMFRIGQGVTAVPDGATAFSHRDAAYLFHPIIGWGDPNDTKQTIAATRAFAATMRPYGSGATYLNFTHEADRVRDAYGDAKYARLVALKDKYDPTNLFRLNQNIRPSQAAAEPALA